MEPDLREGDVLVVCHQASAEPGDIVVASIPGQAGPDGYTVKQLHLVDGHPRLRCINQAVPDPPPDARFRIVGKVTGLLRKL